MSASDIAKKYAPKLATFALVLIAGSPHWRFFGSTHSDLGRGWPGLRRCHQNRAASIRLRRAGCRP